MPNWSAIRDDFERCKAVSEDMAMGYAFAVLPMLLDEVVGPRKGGGNGSAINITVTNGTKHAAKLRTNGTKPNDKPKQKPPVAKRGGG